MYTTVAWLEVAAKALEALNAVADEHITVSGDDITIPIGLDHVLAIQGTGNRLTRAFLSSPSLRRMWLEDLQPFTAMGGLVPMRGTVSLIDYKEDPIPLVASEKLNAIAECDAEGACIVAFLGDGPITPVHGDIRTLRATAAITTEVGVWKSGPLSLSQTLPAGRYQVVGMRPVSELGIAARLLFVGQWARPGSVCTSSLAGINAQAFRRGKFGAFGEFEFDQPPQMEVLGGGVELEQEVFLDLIQIRAGRS